jgi:hypothetical protein
MSRLFQSIYRVNTLAKRLLPAYAVMICSRQWSELCGIHIPAPAARTRLCHYPSMCQAYQEKITSTVMEGACGRSEWSSTSDTCQNHRISHPGRVTAAATAFQCEVLYAFFVKVVVNA